MLVLALLNSFQVFAMDKELKEYIDKRLSDHETKIVKKKFEFGGYFRSGSNVFADGASKNSGQCFSLDYPKNDGFFYRLGNECRDYSEFTLSHLHSKNGINYRSVFMIDMAGDSRSPTSTEPWSRRTRQLYIEMSGLFTFDANLWVGRRYYRSIGNIGDVHMVDSFHVQSSGNGFGLTDVKIGSGTYHFALMAHGQEDSTYNNQNLLLDVRIDQKLNDHNSLQLGIQHLFPTDAKGSAPTTDGTTITGQWQTKQKVFENKIVIQYGTGSFAQNPGCFGTDGACYDLNADDSASGFRIFTNGILDWGPRLKLNYLALYEDSSKYHSLKSVGIRPHYTLSKYWSLLAEVSSSVYEVVNEGEQKLKKLTLALQATLDASSFWERPSIRFYASNFDWNTDAATYSGISRPGEGSKTDATLFGVQGEVWF